MTERPDAPDALDNIFAGRVARALQNDRRFNADERDVVVFLAWMLGSPEREPHNVLTTLGEPVVKLLAEEMSLPRSIVRKALRKAEKAGIIGAEP